MRVLTAHKQHHSLSLKRVLRQDIDVHEVHVPLQGKPHVYTGYFSHHHHHQ